jgi:hypothetical protein
MQTSFYLADVDLTRPRWAFSDFNSRLLSIAAQNRVISVSPIGLVSCCFRSFPSMKAFASSSVIDAACQCLKIQPSVCSHWRHSNVRSLNPRGSGAVRTKSIRVEHIGQAGRIVSAGIALAICGDLPCLEIRRQGQGSQWCARVLRHLLPAVCIELLTAASGCCGSGHREPKRKGLGVRAPRP